MKYIAFLRGISPQNAPSAKLREAFASLGFANVQTVISSGNVIFDEDETDASLLETRIEEQLNTILQIRSRTIIRTSDQIHQLVQSSPFYNQTHSRETYLTVTFLKKMPEFTPMPEINDSTMRIINYNTPNQALFAINDTTITTTPDFMQELEKMYGKDITTRTWNTILRIHKKI